MPVSLDCTSELDAQRRLRGCAVVVAALLLGACGSGNEPVAPEVRPVRTISVQSLPGGETVTLTGRIEAAEEANLSFRVGQRLLERKVGVGDQVEAGDLVARLEPTTFENAVQTARANLAAANAQLADARLSYERQRSLLEQGVAPRAAYDRALAARDTAVAQVDAARAQFDTAREQLTFTELFADSGGIVTAVGAEPGEVVGAGQMIVRIARAGGLDAVFDVPARVKQSAIGVDPIVTMSLVSDPSVRATGRVREVSPQADPVTRTFRVRVGLAERPQAMRLGSTVTGSIHIGEGEGIRIPASALTSADGGPAVFVLDLASSTVTLQPVSVGRHGVADVEVTEGLVADDIVVIAGVQTLRPGQTVRLLEPVQ